jgi:hypothetical protein
MTKATHKSDERATLIAWLRDNVSDWFAGPFENAPIENLRTVVADCKEQEEFYRLCGLQDMSRQEPERAA